MRKLLAMLILVGCVSPVGPEEEIPYDVRVKVVEQEHSITFYARDFSDQADSLAWFLTETGRDGPQFGVVGSSTVAVDYPLGPEEAPPITFCVTVLGAGKGEPGSADCIKWPSGW